MANVKAGQLVRYRDSNADPASGDNVGLVLETSHTTFDDGTPDKDHVVIAALVGTQYEVNENFSVVPLGETIADTSTPTATSTSQTADTITAPSSGGSTK